MKPRPTKFVLNVGRQEVEDMLSALSYFTDSTWGKKNPQTKKAMEKLSRKLWRTLRAKV